MVPLKNFSFFNVRPKNVPQSSVNKNHLNGYCDLQGGMKNRIALKGITDTFKLREPYLFLISQSPNKVLRRVGGAFDVKHVWRVQIKLTDGELHVFALGTASSNQQPDPR